MRLTEVREEGLGTAEDPAPGQEGTAMISWVW
jgi:hypothetical protein